ncbi:MAG TPA: peptidyl-prolyl cis-trans isomerase [Candidatus Sulfotelmatobacter sp.]|nr:peptidyl-prolyl cis-trans isomerase [Candidatus Sulfotelmatobacter sp.]
MIRKNWLLCVLLGTLAWGQAAPSAPAPSQPSQAPAEQEAKPQAPAPAPAMPTPPPAPEDKSASVPANAAVLTIEGVCPPQPKTAASTKTATGAKTSAAKTSTAGCKTIITKAQFEKLANSLAPSVTPQLKKQLAGLLPRLMAMSEDAQKQGLDKTPEFAERVKFVKMQVLSQALQQQIQKKAADIPESELQAYYKEHPETFEQYNLDRIFVPRTKQAETEAKTDEDKDEKLTEEQQKAKEAADKAKAEEGEQAMSKLAEQLRTRAAAGEDFAKLQKEAFEAAGMKIESPTVNLPNVRRTGLPPGHTAVFDLKPGDVSQVISDSGGHYIYKLNSKTEVPFDQAKSEIHSKMQNDRMRDMMEKVNKSFNVIPNEDYFGPGGVGQAPPPHMPRPRPGMPAAQPQNQAPAQPPAAKPN